jgi:hypothetical protein
MLPPVQEPVAYSVLNTFKPDFEKLGATPTIEGDGANSTLHLQFDNSVTQGIVQNALRDSVDGVKLTFGANKQVLSMLDLSPQGAANYLDNAKLDGVGGVAYNNGNIFVMGQADSAPGFTALPQLLKDTISGATVKYEAL